MALSGTPILIVNADDFGRDEQATDRTLAAFREGRLSSATAMVNMDDSERAAQLAREAGLPVGLHVNLTDPFTAAEVPAGARERQLLACRLFAGRRFRLRSWSYDPRVQSKVDSAVADQVERFEALFGARPDHLDGHKHVHSCPNVALAAPLKPIRCMRNGLRAWPSGRGVAGTLRALRRVLTYRRFVTTRYFFDIDKLFRDRDTMAARVGVASETSVEVMVHPGFPHERESLSSRCWANALEGLRLGGFGELDRAG